jgi:RecB family endonuclease NucS
MEKNIGEVEKGLKLVEREHPTSDGPMDFLAKDSNGNNVVIEVKTKADDSTVSQLRRYMRSLKRDTKDSKVRGIIVAEEFTKRCLDDVAELKEHGIDIGLYKCRKKFDFTKV